MRRSSTGARPTVWTAYRWELRKLRSQKRTYIGIGAAMLLPILFVVVLTVQKGGPTEEPLANNLRLSGIVLVLIVLNFTARFAAQLLVALVAGDIVAAETGGGTLKLILTRSLTRTQILTAKILAAFTYVVAVLAAMLVAGLVGGIAAWGFHPIVDLSFTIVSPWHALVLTVAAMGLFAVPLCAIAAFACFLSTVTRNSAASIVGTLVFELIQEALGGLVHNKWVREYVLSHQFDAWQGLFHTPIDWSPIVRSLWVSALYAAVPLAISYVVFRRRDVVGE